MSKIARYWSQVHRVQEMTGVSSAIARATVRELREERGWMTAAETARHPIVTAKVADSYEEEEDEDFEEDEDERPDSFDSVDDWEQWDWDFYEYDEVEGNVDYGKD